MDSLWLEKQFLQHPDKSKADLAASLNLPASSISKMLNGTRQIKAKEYLEMRKFFGFDLDSKTRKNLTAETSPIAALNDREQAEFQNARKPKWDVVVMMDTSMIPLLKPGDRVAIDTNIKTVQRLNLFAYKRNLSSEISINYIEQEDAKHYALIDMLGNRLYVPRAQIEILGQALAILQPL